MALTKSDKDFQSFTEINGLQARRVTSADQEAITLVDTSDSNFIYIGSASPGTATSESSWRIQRVDLTTSEIKILYANQSQEFAQVWDNRAGLSYG